MALTGYMEFTAVVKIRMHIEQMGTTKFTKNNTKKYTVFNADSEDH